MSVRNGSSAPCWTTVHISASCYKNKLLHLLRQIYHFSNVGMCVYKGRHRSVLIVVDVV